jgi:hypothetical protein
MNVREKECPMDVTCVCWGSAVTEEIKKRIIEVLERVPRTKKDTFVPYMKDTRNRFARALTMLIMYSSMKEQGQFKPGGLITDVLLREIQSKANRIMQPNGTTRAYIGPLHMVYTQTGEELTSPEKETIVWCLTIHSLEFAIDKNAMWKFIFREFQAKGITHVALSMPKSESVELIYINQFTESLCQALNQSEKAYGMKLIFVVCHDNDVAYNTMKERLAGCPHCDGHPADRGFHRYATIATSPLW